MGPRISCSARLGSWAVVILLGTAVPTEFRAAAARTLQWSATAVGGVRSPIEEPSGRHSSSTPMIQAVIVLLACLAVFSQGNTCGCQKPQRKSFTVIQDLEYNVQITNDTLVTPHLVYTTCSNPKMVQGPYIISNYTTVSNVITNLFYYKYTGSAANACDTCNLVVPDEAEYSEFPLVGCPLYDITSVKDSTASPKTRSDIVYTYL